MIILTNTQNIGRLNAISIHINQSWDEKTRFVVHMSPFNKYVDTNISFLIIQWCPETHFKFDNHNSTFRLWPIPSLKNISSKWCRSMETDTTIYGAWIFCHKLVFSTLFNDQINPFDDRFGWNKPVNRINWLKYSPKSTQTRRKTSFHPWRICTICKEAQNIQAQKLWYFPFLELQAKYIT